MDRASLRRCAAAVWLSTVVSFAQSTAGLTGTIQDASGAVTPGAVVTVTNVETGVKREVSSSAVGIYEFPLLQPGSYSVSVRKEGFKSVTRDRVRLEVNQVARIDFTMQLGAVNETVDVTGAAPLLESSTSSAGTVIETRAVADLPLNGRNFVQLAILGTGVIGVGFGPTGTIAGGTRPVDLRPGADLMSNGNREQSNSFFLDGVDNNFRRNATITYRPSVDEVLEFKIQTNLFEAEQGRTPGATVNVITKSGSNDLHSSAYEYLRNDAVDAREFFNNTQKPPYRQNQFGATMGGHIVRNKAFFFGSYEGFRKSKGNTSVNTVPTAAERQGDFSAVRDIFDPSSVRLQPGTSSGYVRDPFAGRLIPASRFDSVTGRVIQAYPLPDSPGMVLNQTSKPITRQRWDQGTMRIDYNLSSNDIVFGRYSQQDTTTLPPSTFGPRNIPGLAVPVDLGNDSTYAGNSGLTTYNSVLSWTHIFSPRFLVETRMGFSRFNLAYTADAPSGAQLGEKLGVSGANQGPKSDGIPVFAPANYTGISGASSVPNYKLENTFNPNANFTRTLSRHTLKWGVSFVRRQITDFQTNTGAGSFTFNGLFTSNPNSTGNTGDPMASFLLGTAAGIQQDFLLAWVGIRTLETGAFLQDDWQVTKRLTLNLGMRYDSDTPPSEVANRWTNFDVYTGKLLIAGYNSNRNANITEDNNNVSPRFGFAYRLRSTTVIRGGYGIFSNIVSQAAQLFFLHRQLPFGPINTVVVNQFSATPQRVQDGLAPIPVLDFQTVTSHPTGSFRGVTPNLKSGYAQQYNFAIEQEVRRNMVLKASYVGNLGRQLDNSYNYNQPTPGPGSPAANEPLRFLAPDVATVTYGVSDGRSNYHAFQFNAERRFSSGLGFLAGYTYSHAIDNVALQQGGGSDGPVPQDRRNRQAERASSSFDIRHRLTFAANYQLPFGKGARFDLGRPWANKAFGGWQTNAILIAQGGLPFTPVLANSVSNAGASRPDRLKSGTLSSPTLNHWFDTSFNTAGSAWATPAVYTFGDSGRNILTGPRRVNLDFSLFKEFPITERYRLQFRSEFFNVLNHPQFDLPNATIGSPTAGTINAIVGTPRDIQFSLRFSF